MLELNWISIFQGSLIIGAILAVFVMVFDEVFCFEGPINFSELVTGITVFGGAGILLSERTNFSMMLIILFAIAIALLVTLAFYYLYLKPMRESENSTAFSIQDLVGEIGEVITPIGNGKYGEVILRIGASYTNQIAASRGEEEIPRGAKVKVEFVEEGPLYVSWPKEEERKNEEEK